MGGFILELEDRLIAMEGKLKEQHVEITSPMAGLTMAPPPELSKEEAAERAWRQTMNRGVGAPYQPAPLPSPTVPAAPAKKVKVSEAKARNMCRLCDQPRMETGTLCARCDQDLKKAKGMTRTPAQPDMAGVGSAEYAGDFA